MKFTVITLFPEFIENLESYSIIGRAIKEKKIELVTLNLRDFGRGNYHQVDDKPYGGGVGMLMRVDIVHKAIQAAKKKAHKNHKVILLSPEGKQFTQKTVESYAKIDEIIIICGHYEGFDQRIKNFVDEVVAVGQYVLSGGEIAAMAIVDSVSRQIEGVLGKDESKDMETFSSVDNKRIIEYPQFTRPEEYLGLRVPKILLEGNHLEIQKWREKNTKNTSLD